MAPALTAGGDLAVCAAGFGGGPRTRHPEDGASSYGLWFAVFSATPCSIRAIFAERFSDGALAPLARRTERLDCIVHHLGLALGGRPAAAFAARLMTRVSTTPCCASSGVGPDLKLHRKCVRPKLPCCFTPPTD